MGMKSVIAYPDFEKIDIRIGTVTDATIPDWSHKLIRFEVDFGEEGKKIIFSGIKSWYAPEDFVGKQFPFLINLTPKKMGAEESQGMMLMVDVVSSTEAQASPVLISLNMHVPDGSVIR